LLKPETENMRKIEENNYLDLNVKLVRTGRTCQIGCRRQCMWVVRWPPVTLYQPVQTGCLMCLIRPQSALGSLIPEIGITPSLGSRNKSRLSTMVIEFQQLISVFMAHPSNLLGEVETFHIYNYVYIIV
jgi:hypothetical protein